jgi:hypothetical protein
MNITDGNSLARAKLAQARYPINLRITIPFYRWPIFVTLIVGSEKRGRNRLHNERGQHPVNTWGNVFAVTIALSIASIAALFVVLVASVH